MNTDLSYILVFPTMPNPHTPGMMACHAAFRIMIWVLMASSAFIINSSAQPGVMPYICFFGHLVHYNVALAFEKKFRDEAWRATRAALLQSLKSRLMRSREMSAFTDWRLYAAPPLAFTMLPILYPPPFTVHATVATVQIHAIEQPHVIQSAGNGIDACPQPHARRAKKCT